ncbi:hypothetical protein GC163_13175 [bacterium]|nr:hypothetical protein [bacterium]
MADNRQSDFGGIPGTDYRTLEWWAESFQRSQEFVRKHCDQLGVPYRRFGDVVCYSASKMLDAMPEMTKETDDARKRGGRRGRKAA